MARYNIRRTFQRDADMGPWIRRAKWRASAYDYVGVTSIFSSRCRSRSLTVSAGGIEFVFMLTLKIFCCGHEPVPRVMQWMSPRSRNIIVTTRRWKVVRRGECTSEAEHQRRITRRGEDKSPASGRIPGRHRR